MPYFFATALGSLMHRWEKKRQPLMILAAQHAVRLCYKQHLKREMASGKKGTACAWLMHQYGLS
jgi:hypothetical protein